MLDAFFPQQLLLTFAQPSARAYYSSNALSLHDSTRVARERGPKAELDWQVSRALLRACRQREGDDRAESLSHSRGHAVLAQAPLACKVGVDMEMIRPRRVMALAEWACNATEIDWLLGQDDPLAQHTSFYMLWTLKEAFVKAAGLAFPSDLSRVGLDCATGNAPSLRAPDGAWLARTYLLGSDCVISAVWHPMIDQAMGEEPVWRAGPSSVLPPLAILGAWRQHAGSAIS